MQPPAQQQLRESLEDILPWNLQRVHGCDTLNSDLCAPELWRNPQETHAVCISEKEKAHG